MSDCDYFNSELKRSNLLNSGIKIAYVSISIKPKKTTNKLTKNSSMTLSSKIDDHTV